MTPLLNALVAVLDRIPAGPAVPVALSGGLDSWVLAMLLRNAGRDVRAVTLASGIDGYCEFAQVDLLSRRFAIPLEVIAAGAEDFESALPRFLAITRTPIYNLHPVSKLLLAEGLAARGIPAIVTGDAADQVFRCETECDLLPLTQSCFRHTQVELILPFLSENVRQLCHTPDPDKRPLRELAASLGLPNIAKRPTLYPGEDILPRTTQMLEAILCAASPA